MNQGWVVKKKILNFEHTTENYEFQHNKIPEWKEYGTTRKENIFEVHQATCDRLPKHMEEGSLVK